MEYEIIPTINQFHQNLLHLILLIMWVKQMVVIEKVTIKEMIPSF
jgi:hypothetical protein